MKKALLTSTAVLALGMFGFGVRSASAAGTNIHVGLSNIPVAVATGGSTATATNTSLNGSLNHNNVPIASATHGAAASQNSTAGYATTRDAHDTATSGTGSAINDSTVGSYNGTSAKTGSGGGVAASGGSFATQLNGSADIVAPGGLLSNGTLTATSSFNHVDADLTLATASAGGSMGGHVTDNNQNGVAFYGFAGYTNDNGSRVTNNIDGSTGVITANANGNGIAQFNTSVAAVGVDNSSGLMHSTP